MQPGVHGTRRAGLESKFENGEIISGKDFELIDFIQFFEVFELLLIFPNTV